MESAAVPPLAPASEAVADRARSTRRAQGSDGVDASMADVEDESRFVVESHQGACRSKG